MSTAAANKARTKYPIIDGKKECGNCHALLPLSFFSTANRKGYRADCKSCRSIASALYQLNKKIEKYPHLYYQCNDEDCLWIWRKQRGGFCPKCLGEGE